MEDGRSPSPPLRAPTGRRGYARLEAEAVPVTTDEPASQLGFAHEWLSPAQVTSKIDAIVDALLASAVEVHVKIMDSMGAADAIQQELEEAEDRARNLFRLTPRLLQRLP